MNESGHRPPRTCPVCGEVLHLTKLACHACGTELSGDFQPCEFCSLAAEDLAVLRQFLSSRGNLKSLERQLGVSYPTARARVDAVLLKLGLESRLEPVPESPVEVMQALARGEIDVDEAASRLQA